MGKVCNPCIYIMRRLTTWFFWGEFTSIALHLSTTLPNFELVRWNP